MKTLILAILSILALQAVHAAPSQEETARFVAAAREAFAEHDTNALAALTCWDRVPEKLKVDGMKQYARDVAQPVSDIALIDPDPSNPDLVWKDDNGVSYRSNLPVIKQLKITFKGGEFSEGWYPVGEKDDKFYLLEPAPVK